MNDMVQVKLTGSVRDLFAHRFILRTPEGSVLADLTPEGAERIQLLVGDEITIEGERKPSEIKVWRVVRGSEVVELQEDDLPKQGRKNAKIERHEDKDAKAAASATRAATEAGLTPIGKPRRKNKHFEILGRDGAGNLVELHVDREGAVGKQKIVEADSDKWSDEIKDEP